jgi:uncharacterized 2Fe-2S/4Fe-4S cluster protein (DUF4445 family)
MIKNNISTDHFLVIMQPVGRRAHIRSDQSLLEAAQTAGVEILSICGGIGACGSCKIRLITGELSGPTLDEQELLTAKELKAGFRLACQSYPISDLKIDIPPESLSTPQRLQLEGQGSLPSIDPSVIPLHVTVQPPSLDDLRSDSTRLRDAISSDFKLKNLTCDYSLLTTISPVLRDANWDCIVAIRDNRIISLLPYNNQQNHWSPLLGLAVDIGTTKIAAYLVDLTTGETLAKTGAMNPQIAYGEDVISRISYANRQENKEEPPARKILQNRVVQTLNEMIAEMRLSLESVYGRITRDQIVDAVIVGNTAMHHLFAGYPVKQLGESPYVPAVSEASEILSRDIGLEISPGSSIYLPPNIAGYVGADHVAMVLSTLFDDETSYTFSDKTVMAIDIGTNTEITLCYKGEMVCCSCASGPAFEGAHIQDGMRAAPGAIERVQIEKDAIHLKTINNLPPVGICGSGILDSISELISNNIIDYRGIFDKKHPRVVSGDKNQSQFLLVEASSTGHGHDIFITRRDVNEIQLAKGAIRAGIEILLKEVGIEANQIDKFIIAGAFGTYIDIESALRVGMFPLLPIDRFSQVGNAAGAGARQMLISKQRRKSAQDISTRLKYVELSSHPDFTTEFSKSLFFPGKSPDSPKPDQNKG